MASPVPAARGDRLHGHETVEPTGSACPRLRDGFCPRWRGVSGEMGSGWHPAKRPPDGCRQGVVGCRDRTDSGWGQCRKSGVCGKSRLGLHRRTPRKAGGFTGRPSERCSDYQDRSNRGAVRRKAHAGGQAHSAAGSPSGPPSVRVDVARRIDEFSRTSQSTGASNTFGRLDVLPKSLIALVDSKREPHGTRSPHRALSA